MSATWFDCWNAADLGGDLFWTVSGERHLHQGCHRDFAELGVVVFSTIDKDGDADGKALPGFDDGNCFAHAPAASDDIFDNQDAFAFAELEATPQFEGVIFFFGEEEAGAALPGDFLSDDEAAHSGGEDGLKSDFRWQFGEEEAGEAGNFIHVFADACALEEVAAVEARAQDKVSLEEGTGFFKNLCNFRVIGGHVRGFKEVCGICQGKTFLKNALVRCALKAGRVLERLRRCRWWRRSREAIHFRGYGDRGERRNGSRPGGHAMWSWRGNRI